MKVSADQIDALIVQGRGAEARDAVTALAASKVPRAEAANLAGLSWRCGMPHIGIRLLHRYVRPRPTQVSEPTIFERAEYAQCLIRIGAHEEGARMLKELPVKELPRILLYEAGLLVSRWDYPASIPLLSKYLRTPGLDEYQQLVAKTNLAAARIWDGHPRDATPLLRDVLHTSSLRGYRLLLGRSLEISAENFVAMNKWSRAREFLREAEKRLESSASLDAFFVRKYHAVVDLFELDDDKRLVAFREEAAKVGHDESLRDCDRFIALRRHDAKLLTHLYFGTPYGAYRKKLLHDFGDPKGAELPGDYVWSPGGHAPGMRTFDVAAGKFEDGSAKLPQGSLLHRLVVILATDFYRPTRIAEIHAQLHPGDFYNPVTSPRAVHEVIRRLREWFAKNDVPLTIVESAETYRLQGSAPCGLRLTRGGVKAKRYGSAIHQLREKFGENGFSAPEAAKVLELPFRTLQRALGKAVEDGELARSGAAAKTRYTFPPAKKAKKSA